LFKSENSIFFLNLFKKQWCKASINTINIEYKKSELERFYILDIEKYIPIEISRECILTK